MDTTALKVAKKRGKPGHFTGFKLAFLRLLAVQYAIWRAEGRSGAFYDYATRKFFRTFGRGDLHLDPAEDPGEPECDEDDEGEDSGCATQAEADTAKTQFDGLRMVRICCDRQIVLKLTHLCQILCNWFRATYRRTTGAGMPAEKTQSEAQPTLDHGPLGKLLGGMKGKPHRRSPFSVYQEKHYATRVAAEYKRRWANELKEYAAHTPQQRVEKGIEKPKSIRTMTSTSVEFWRKESKEFKDKVQAEADACYTEALSTYELGLAMPKTALDYHK